MRNYDDLEKQLKFWMAEYEDLESYHADEITKNPVRGAISYLKGRMSEMVGKDDLPDIPARMLNQATKT